MNEVDKDNVEDFRISEYEYTALKTEQTYRIQTRDNSLLTNFLTIGGVAAIAFSGTEPKKEYLVIIPFISFCCCWIYYSNDIIITNIRKFLNLSENLGLKWEEHHREIKTLNFRKGITFITSMIGFVLIGSLIQFLIYPVPELKFLFYTGVFFLIANTFIILLNIDWHER